MKSETTKQHGAKRTDIDICLEEFMFRRRNIDINDQKGVKKGFSNFFPMK